MKNIASKLLLSLIIMSSSITATIDHNNFVKNPKIILFDIQDVLIDVQKMRSAYDHFGFINSVRALFQGNLNDFYTSLLGQIPSPHPAPTYTNQIKGLGKGINGKNIPDIQRDFLLGKLTSAQCTDICNNWIENNKSKFESDYQTDLFKRMVSFYFEPKTFLKFHTKTSCMDLMKRLYDIKTKNGKRKNIIIIVSNQSKEHVVSLKELFPDIFKYSDEQFFSCNEGCLKPDITLLEKCFSLCPASAYCFAFFVDNSVEIDSVNVKNKFLQIIKSNVAEDELNACGALCTQDGI